MSQPSHAEYGFTTRSSFSTLFAFSQGHIAVVIGKLYLARGFRRGQVRARGGVGIRYGWRNWKSMCICSMTAAILAMTLGRPPTSESTLLVIITSISTARSTNYSEKGTKHRTDPVYSTEAVAGRQGFQTYQMSMSREVEIVCPSVSPKKKKKPQVVGF